VSILLCHASDLHHSAQNAKYSLPVLKEFVDVAIAEECRVCLFCGDVWDHVVLNSESSSLVPVLDEFKRLADHMPVLMIAGNQPHDVVGSLDVFERLETTFPIRVSKTYETVYLSGLGQWCDEFPKDAECILQVHCIPYPTVRLLCPNSEGVADPMLVSRQMLSNVFQHFSNETRASVVPTVLVGHFAIDGSDQNGTPLFEPLGVSLEQVLRVGADYTALGHIHNAHQRMLELQPVKYAGSMFHKTFGEPEEKGFWIVDVEKGSTKPTWHKLQSTCPLLLKDVQLEETSFFDYKAGAGKRVRVRLHVDKLEARSDELQKELTRLYVEAGAVDVKVEFVVEQAESKRSIEVTMATTLADKYDAYCRSIDHNPSGELVFVTALQSSLDPVELEKL